MEREEYERMYQLEDSHWWFAGKRRIAGKLLESASLRGSVAPLLDIGCGTGAMLRFLSRYGVPFGVDISEVAVSFCLERGLEGVCQASAQSLPFGDSRFALVTAFDVLYHRRVDDDQIALRECARVLRPGGWLLITDSALPWLRSTHDEVTHARQRYGRAELRDKVRAAGFTVRRLSYSNTLLFPLVVAVRLAGKWKSQQAQASDLKQLPGPLNSLLRMVYGIEAEIIPRLSLPIGSTLVCLAQRPGA